MKGKATKEMLEARKEHDQQIHMLKAPSVMARESSAKASKVNVKVQHESTDENRMEEWFWMLLSLYDLAL